MTQIFMPDNNPETPFNTEKVSRKGRKGKVDVRTLYMADTIQAISQKNARMWQIIALVSLVSFFISLGICFYAVTLPKTVPVIVTVDSDGYTNYVGKVDRSAYGKTAVPEQAKTYVIKKLITNMHTRVIDPEAQRRFIDECLHVCQGSAVTQLDEFFMVNNPFSRMGIITSTVSLEEPLKQSERTYVIYFTVSTYQSGNLIESHKFSALISLDFFPGTPETNPLGIYVSSFDIKPLKQ